MGALAIRRRGANRPTLLPITDDFNRANSTTDLGSASGGQAWVQHQGTWGINTNRAYTSAGGLGYATVDAGQPAYTASVFGTSLSASNFTGPVVRFISTSDQYYLLVSNTSYSLRRVLSGTTTVAASGSVAVGTSGTLALRVTPTAITVVINGVDQTTHATTTHASATRAGLFVGNGSVRVDDFSLTS